MKIETNNQGYAATIRSRADSEHESGECFKVTCTEKGSINAPKVASIMYWEI